MKNAMTDVQSCYVEITELSAPRLAETATIELYRQLLFATASDDYESVAAELVEEFLSAVEKIGPKLAVPYKDLFATLVQTFPQLREPLKRMLDDCNPFKDLLPEEEPPHSAPTPKSKIP